MIKQLANYDFFNQMSLDNPYATRIYTTFKTYGINKYVNYWLQDEKTIICKNYNAYILDIDKNADVEEIKAFLDYCHAPVAICDGKYNINFGKKPSVSAVLKFCGSDNNLKFNLDSHFVLNSKPDTEKLYRFFSDNRSEDFSVPDCEIFLSVINAKMNSGCAACVSIEESDKIVAAAFSADITPKSGIVTAVAVDKAYRNMGLGSLLVKSLIQIIGHDKSIFLHRSLTQNKNFYKELNFAMWGICREISS